MQSSSEEDVNNSNSVSNIQDSIQSSEQDVGFSPCQVLAFSLPIASSSSFVQLHTGCSPSAPTWYLIFFPILLPHLLPSGLQSWFWEPDALQFLAVFFYFTHPIHISLLGGRFVN